MRFSRKTHDTYDTYTINLAGNMHLRITSDKKLDFVDHINVVVYGFNQTIGFIERNNREFKNTQSMVVSTLMCCRI